MSKRVLFWGRFDPGYSRNRVYAALFRELGWEVDYFFVKLFPRFGDVEAAVRGLGRRPKPDLVWVPVCRQRDILAACRWAHKRGVKVLFDPMISAWDKKVLEQRKWKADEPRARRLLAREQVNGFVLAGRQVCNQLFVSYRHRNRCFFEVTKIIVRRLSSGNPHCVYFATPHR